MRISWRDGATTLMAGAVAVIFVAHFQQWSWPVVDDVRLSTLAVGVIGLAMCIVGADPTVATARSGYAVIANSLGVAALVLVVIGLIFAWPVAFTGLVMLTLVLYAVATVRHVLVGVPMARPV